jgi:hypothetical protein
VVAVSVGELLRVSALLFQTINVAGTPGV